LKQIEDISANDIQKVFRHARSLNSFHGRFIFVSMRLQVFLHEWIQLLLPTLVHDSLQKLSMQFEDLYLPQTLVMQFLNNVIVAQFPNLISLELDGLGLVSILSDTNESDDSMSMIYKTGIPMHRYLLHYFSKLRYLTMSYPDPTNTPTVELPFRIGEQIPETDLTFKPTLFTLWNKLNVRESKERSLSASSITPSSSTELRFC
jgi:hypothetical protein